jgi:Putative peptidoglycan binding domain
MLLQKGSQGSDVDLLQKNLADLGFYGHKVDGDFGNETEISVKDFQRRSSLVIDGKAGDKTLAAIKNALAQNPQYPFSYFKKFKVIQDDMIAGGAADSNHFAFLDRGVDEVKADPAREKLPNRAFKESPYKKEISNYPEYLLIKPDGLNLLTHPNKTNLFGDYPDHGQIPNIEDSLDFLSGEIGQACICIGSFDANGNLKVRWLGRDALNPVQFWSSTKYVQVLNLVCQANKNAPDVKIENCNIRDSQEQKGLPFTQLVEEMVRYQKIEGNKYVEDFDRSNQIATMFKRFETSPCQNLTTWFSHLTGNKNIQFEKGYSKKSFIKEPNLYIRDIGTNLVNFQSPGASYNRVSAYDLVRMFSMLGWHNYLPIQKRFPDAQWHSLSSVIKCLGYDTARYLDVALEALSLQTSISHPVIFSKMGYGLEGDDSKGWAITYAAFVQLKDHHSGDPAKLRTLSMALRIPTTNDATGRKHDAKMSAEVTEILRRVVDEELV